MKTNLPSLLSKNRISYLRNWSQNLLNSSSLSTVYDEFAINILAVLINEYGFENLDKINPTVDLITQLSSINKYKILLENIDFKKLNQKQLETIIYPVKIYLEDPNGYFNDRYKILISQ